MLITDNIHVYITIYRYILYIGIYDYIQVYIITGIYHNISTITYMYMYLLNVDMNEHDPGTT